MTDGTKTRPDSGTQKLVLVTGPSGSGRKTAIDVLEDLDFEAIDNLPLTLLPRLLSAPATSGAVRPMALGMDARNRDFSVEGLIEVVDIIGDEAEFECTLVYLDCTTDVLVRRYSETRRRHPLSMDGAPLDGIEEELALLEPLRQRADVLIDTSNLSPHDLKAELATWFADEVEGKLTVSIQSFSYKRGLPRGVDMVLDSRFLRNPHWEADLRPLDGRDADVAAYVAEDPRFSDFFAKVQDLLLTLLPYYRAEGKSHFSVAIGCTGGQHRSVFVAEAIAKALAPQGWQVSIRHREIERRTRRGALNQQVGL